MRAWLREQWAEWAFLFYCIGILVHHRKALHTLYGLFNMVSTLTNAVERGERR
jgi:hypothetical protein